MRYQYIDVMHCETTVCMRINMSATRPMFARFKLCLSFNFTSKITENGTSWTQRLVKYRC